MVTVLVLFGHPRDEPAFRTYFEDTHRPLLRQIPHVERVTVHGVVGAVEGTAPYACVVELDFPSDETMQAGLNSAAGLAMARDFRAFASGGVTVLLCRASRDHPAKTTTRQKGVTP